MLLDLDMRVFNKESDDKALQVLKGVKVNFNTSINVMYLVFVLLLNKSSRDNMIQPLQRMFSCKSCRKMSEHLKLHKTYE